jgi:hypothetical protein
MKLLLPEKVGEKKLVVSFLKKVLLNSQPKDTIYLTKEGKMIFISQFVRLEIELGEFFDMEDGEGIINTNKVAQIFEADKSIDIDIVILKCFEKAEETKELFKHKLEDETLLEQFLGYGQCSFKPYQNLCITNDDRIIDFISGETITELKIESSSILGYSSFSIPKVLSKIMPSNTYIFSYEMHLIGEKRVIQMKFQNILSSNLSFKFEAIFYNMKQLVALGS